MKKKRIIGLVIASVCIFGVSMTGAAKTLAQSFSGGSSYQCVGINGTTGAQQYKKSTYAKTEGYAPYHYVHSYIGGSKNSAAKAVASYKVYGGGDLYAECDYSLWIDKGSLLFYKALFPTGYAKYGSY